MKWDKEKIQVGLWSAVGGAIILLIIGFNWGGWVTGGTAQKTGEEMAEEAVVSRLAPICVEQFRQDSEKVQKVKEMKAKDDWMRGDYVEKQGWATMPGEKKPADGVARKCAEMLMKLT
jgi:hypothetical protein